jgi:predicted small secreted protein
MSIRLALLPSAVIALPFLVNACINEPTAAGTGSRAPAATLLAVDAVSLKLNPTAGNFPPPDFLIQTGNGPYSQARWTNKVALDGKFSVLLEKSVDFASCNTPTPLNGCAAFAAVIVSGVEGTTIADLGDIGFSVSGTCGGGSPRFNLYYDTDSDGQADGVAFYGCAAHVIGTATGWTSMSVSAATPDFCYTFPSDPCTLTSGSTVVELSVLVDELGAWNIDRVQAAGATTGEPNGT